MEFSILPKNPTKLTLLSILTKEKILGVASFVRFLEELKNHILLSRFTDL